MSKKIVSFISRQIKQIHKGGLPVLFRKLSAILLILLSVPVIIVIRVLRPLILIRFGSLLSSRIGHFAAATELYLCSRDIAGKDGRVFDVFYHNGPICNQQLKKMWERIINVSSIAYWLDRTNRLMPGADKHVVPPLIKVADTYALFERTQVHLSFTPKEECLGETALRELDIPNGASFVCFHSRSSAYLENMFPNENWRYHNYRDSSIKNYIPAAEELTHRGYFTIRMGAVVEEPLQTTNSMIIDYAVNNRTDFLDIYLGAKCRFFICDTAGIYAIPAVFRRPIAWVNFIVLQDVHTWGKNYLSIPKKLWLRSEHRFLTFREILDSEIGRLLHSEKYERLGIEVIENTPEEITDVAVEMDERLKGSWQTTEEDEQLQQRFWALFKPSELNQVFLSRIGAKFLRQNRELLETG